MKEVKHTHVILVGKFERNSHLGLVGIDGRISYIEKELQETGRVVVNWINLAEDTDMWCALVSIFINLWG
jgi:hypothetical protein